jgi:hypothetical protein
MMGELVVREEEVEGGMTDQLLILSQQVDDHLIVNFVTR